jgi:drug/metabolite transporter (DMT)-like permease
MTVSDPADDTASAHYLAGLGWMLLAQLCFAVMNVSARLAGSDLPWQEVAAARFLVGALLVLLLARVRGVSLRVTQRRASWGRAILGTLSALCTFYALTSPRIHLADAATLGATAPVFVALLAPTFLGEPRSRSASAAVVIAFAGIGLVLQPRFESAIGVAAIATLGALFYAFAMMLPLTYLGILFTVLLAIPVFGERPSPPQIAGALAVIAAGLLLARSGHSASRAN